MTYFQEEGSEEKPAPMFEGPTFQDKVENSIGLQRSSEVESLGLGLGETDSEIQAAIVWA